eukprot:TRINITY_DN20523_c0_g1_i2.p1 TRINITY_DN20523_c0_g1~~TRINITY_DN20523_c0_g1_i2.p1  ORF type:complete len:312 (+),score=43.36 TRINITY_DN20523_c0_g1_i2:102-938(+)
MFVTCGGSCIPWPKILGYKALNAAGTDDILDTSLKLVSTSASEVDQGFSKHLPTQLQYLNHDLDEDELRAILESKGVDTLRFGLGKSKPLSSLLHEIKEGSCQIAIDEKTQKLCRVVEPVFVQLLYCDKVLVEDAHILPNGNRRERNTVLAEKKEPQDASILDAALRGIEEELGMVIKLSNSGLEHDPDSIETFIEKKDSASYPGIPCIYKTHHVCLRIAAGSPAEKLFSSCGLPACTPFETTETKPQGTLTSFWKWMGVTEALDSGTKGMRPPTASC